jgi:hypothetical protein
MYYICFSWISMVKFSWDDTKTSWRLVRLAQMEGPGFGHGAVQLLTPQT